MHQIGKIDNSGRVGPRGMATMAMAIALLGVLWLLMVCTVTVYINLSICSIFVIQEIITISVVGLLL